MVDEADWISVDAGEPVRNQWTWSRTLSKKVEKSWARALVAATYLCLRGRFISWRGWLLCWWVEGQRLNGMSCCCGSMQISNAIRPREVGKRRLYENQRLIQRAPQRILDSPPLTIESSKFDKGRKEYQDGSSSCESRNRDKEVEGHSSSIIISTLSISVGWNSPCSKLTVVIRPTQRHLRLLVFNSHCSGD